MMSDGPKSAFEDIIDGYFPLNVSIHHLMRRRGLSFTKLTLTQAPIMHVPGLALHDPVPLSLKSGRAGIIERMDLEVAVVGDSCSLSGGARWRWLDGTDPGERFDPNTRLAEPAYLEGVALEGLRNGKPPPAFIGFSGQDH